MLGRYGGARCLEERDGHVGLAVGGEETFDLRIRASRPLEDVGVHRKEGAERAFVRFNRAREASRRRRSSRRRELRTHATVNDATSYS